MAVEARPSRTHSPEMPEEGPHWLSEEFKLGVTKSIHSPAISSSPCFGSCIAVSLSNRYEITGDYYRFRQCRTGQHCILHKSYGLLGIGWLLPTNSKGLHEDCCTLLCLHVRRDSGSPKVQCFPVE